MEFNDSNLVHRVSALAQNQPPEWKTNALRALENEPTLVQRDFFDERDDAAAIFYLAGLTKCAH